MPPGAPFCLEWLQGHKHPQLGSSNIPHCRLLLPETPGVPLLKYLSYAKPGIGHRNRLPQRCGLQGTRESSPVAPCVTHPLYQCGAHPLYQLLRWSVISLQLKRQWSLLQQPECQQALGSESQHRSRGDWNGDFTVISPFTTPEGAVRITFVISRGVLSPFGKEFPLYLLQWTPGGNTAEKL